MTYSYAAIDLIMLIFLPEICPVEQVPPAHFTGPISQALDGKHPGGGVIVGL